MSIYFSNQKVPIISKKDSIEVNYALLIVLSDFLLIELIDERDAEDLNFFNVSYYLWNDEIHLKNLIVNLCLLI